MENLKELKKQTIKKLEELREEIPNKSNEDNYCDITNALVDYDNEAQDNLYLYDKVRNITEFIDADELDDYIKCQDWSVARLRCFINDTYDDTIYKFDGYGNIDNVCDDDFYFVIDEMIDYIKESEKE